MESKRLGVGQVIICYILAGCLRNCKVPFCIFDKFRCYNQNLMENSVGNVQHSLMRNTLAMTGTSAGEVCVAALILHFRARLNA